MHLSPILLTSLTLTLTQASIWPAPKKLTTGNTTLFIDESLKITYNGDPVRWNSPSLHDTGGVFAQHAETPLNLQLPYTDSYKPDTSCVWSSKAVVQGAVSRSLNSIFHQNFVPWMLHERNSQFEPDVHGSGQGRVKSLSITQNSKDDSESPYTSLTEDVDESYTLSLSEDGVAEIKAPTAIGVLRALESFSQLFYSHTTGKDWYTTHAPVSVEDKPKYPHRGLLMDTARSFFPVKDILRTIDALSWSKMNKLHIHATDSQSWPLDIPAMPDLSAKGAYRKGLSYTPEDIQYIHEYAVHRGVQVIVEIDMPGHTGSIAHAYPELIVAYNQQPYQWWCAEPPCGAFKLNSTAVDSFLDKLFDDLLPRVAPYTAYFHTGGDELNKNDSMLDEGVRSNSFQVLQPLLQRFVDKNHARVRKHGLVPMVWEEMATEWNIKMGMDVVVQTWLGEPSIKQVTGLGHKVIDSNYNFWYLDCGRGHWLNFDNGAAFKAFYPFQDWCSPAKGWRLIYSHDPAEGLTEQEAKLVLGGEVTAWSESIDAVSLDTVLWPRTSAAGEVLWSGRTDASGQNRSQYDAAPRLAEFRERMVARGVGSAPVHMPFCTQASPEECAFVM
ncbi:hypothetical protein VDGD_04484 [Verticillium dahliae]|nr:hypothetical protein VdG1_01245 [Verticillium dahliae VDG1]RBQ70056.1 hypothetical protein VDGD_04484 [Verticillium dahliae]